MFRVQMSASRHSSVSCESDSVVRALLGSSRVRELQVSRGGGAAGIPTSRSVASSASPRLVCLVFLQSSVSMSLVNAMLLVIPDSYSTPLRAGHTTT